jgi:hypothetical protein
MSPAMPKQPPTEEEQETLLRRVTEALGPKVAPLRDNARKLGSAIENRAGKRWFRLLIAAVLACGHLVMFDLAGHKRLDIDFSSSSEPPYYSDPHATVLGGYPRQPHHWSRLVASRWDAEIYISFAIRGLSACPDKESPGYLYMHCGLAWLPAYGVLGGKIASVFDMSPDYTLMMISIIATIFVNFWWTSKFISDRIGVFESYATLLAFNMYPSAFYMVAPYTEALTLALVFLGLWAIQRDRWIVSSLLVGAACGLRGTGIVFSAAYGLAALVAAYERRKAKRKDWWRPLAGIPLCAWLLAFEMLMFKIYVGDALAYVHARKAFGDYQDFSRLIDATFYLKGFTSQHMDSVMLFGMVGIIVLAGRKVLAKFPHEQIAFLAFASLGGMLVVIPTVHEYWGINRYLLLCPLGFMAAGVISRQHKWIYVLWLILCAWMYWHVELCSYVAHGDPRYCPCLGRMEWMAPYQS